MNPTEYLDYKEEQKRLTASVSDGWVIRNFKGTAFTWGYPFEADLYFENAKVAYVINKGDGGGTYTTFTSHFALDEWNKEVERLNTNEEALLDALITEAGY